MKKLGIKITCVLFVLTAAFSAQGCGGNYQQYDPNRTQIFIGNWNGGVGYEWLQNAKIAFESIHTEYEIIIENKKDEFEDNNLLVSMPYSTNDLYFLTHMNYADYVNKGLIEDITDIVTKKTYGEDGDLTNENAVTSIEDKMRPVIRDYYNVGTAEAPLYYGVPFFESVYGIVYDIDLFEENGFYNDGFGLDGKEGTYDDGLPRTYEEFKHLLTKMVQSGVTPFTWSGMHKFYRNEFLLSIYAGYEGLDNFNLNYTLQGNDLGQNLTVSHRNAYLLQNQEGKKAALQVAYDIASNPSYYSQEAYKTATTHIHAQEEFLFSKRTSKRIAMLLEGGWWENEAKDFFKEMERFGGENAYGKRRFGLMPFPKFEGTPEIADQQNSGQSLFLSQGKSAIVINAKSGNKEIAKQFIEFIHSNERLTLFTSETGVTRPYDYDLGDAYNDLTTFSKSIWDLTRDDSLNIGYYNITKDKMILENVIFFNDFTRFRSTIGTVTHSDPLMDFYLYKGLTVEQYRQGLNTTYSEQEWNERFQSYYN